jgi:hypothetical protein
MRDYTEKEIIENIKALKEGKEENITLPIRILKNNFPLEFKKYKIKAYREANKDKIKAYYEANKDKINNKRRKGKL